MTAGELITCDEVMVKYRVDDKRKKEEEQDKTDRGTARAANLAAKNAAAAARASQGTAREWRRGRDRGGSGVSGQGRGHGS